MKRNIKYRSIKTKICFEFQEQSLASNFQLLCTQEWLFLMLHSALLIWMRLSMLCCSLILFFSCDSNFTLTSWVAKPFFWRFLKTRNKNFLRYKNWEVLGFISLQQYFSIFFYFTYSLIFHSAMLGH